MQLDSEFLDWYSEFEGGLSALLISAALLDVSRRVERLG